MTTIRANCPSCGDIQLRANEIVIRVCTDDDSGSYCFQCPNCQVRTAKNASRRVVDLLVSSGVKMQTWQLPDELHSHPPDAPALTPDDLLDFHMLLETTTDVVSLMK